MPQFRAPGVQPWNVSLLGTVSPQIITNPDGSNATRFGGIYTDTVQSVTISVYDTTQSASLTANKIFSTISQTVQSTAAPPSGGCELNNGLVIEFKAGVGGNVYIYWK